MSLAIVKARALVGVSAPLVHVEVHLSGGLPALSIVGLPEAGVRESRERVRSALLNSGFEFPQRRITINLAPADLPKEGGRYDLAIAIGILAASGQIPDDHIDQMEFLGELALSGEVRPVNGVLPAAMAAHQAKAQLVVSPDNLNEAMMVSGIEALAPPTLLAMTGFFRKQVKLPLHTGDGGAQQPEQDHPDLADVKGQSKAKRALEVAAAGGHNLLLIGPPGSGKSMMARRLAGLLPPMDDALQLEVAALHSIVSNSGICARLPRPFRSPHHTTSAVALVGGGSHPRPGEISLAHGGILFLDELPEFSRQVLEVMREPLETGEVHISRAARTACFGAGFQLVAAMNPCPCGYANDGSGRCRCTPDRIRQYQSKISGPLLDRIDMQLWVDAVKLDELLSAHAPEEPSADVRMRVTEAQERQWQRQQSANSRLTGQGFDAACVLTEEVKRLILKAADRHGLSARATHRVLKVARTVADLAGAETIEVSHLLEALSYRQGLSNGGKA